MALTPLSLLRRAEPLLELALVVLGCTVVPLSLLLPEPHPDRLAELTEANTGTFGRPLTEEPPEGLIAARAAYYDRTIRSTLAPPFLVLDAGRGSGSLAGVLGGLPNYTVRVVDGSGRRLHGSRDRQPRKGPGGLQLREEPLHRMSFEDETFDAVFLSNVLEHSLDVRGVLTEANRVLRPGGLLFCDTIDRSLMSFLGGHIVRMISPGSHDWRMLIRPGELERGLEEADFQCLTYQAWRPSVHALHDLLLLSLGHLPADNITGAWSAGRISPRTFSYVAHATKVAEPPLRYQVGEPVGVFPASLDPDDRVALCGIASLGFEPDTYNLDCCQGSERRLLNVHASSLLRWPRFHVGALARVWNSSGWLDCRVAGWGSAACTWRVELLYTGQELDNVPHERLQAEAKYSLGDRAEVQVQVAKGTTGTEDANATMSPVWAKCSVIGIGIPPGTYHVRVPLGGQRHTVIHNVHEASLRALPGVHGASEQTA